MERMTSKPEANRPQTAAEKLSKKYTDKLKELIELRRNVEIEVQRLTGALSALQDLAKEEAVPPSDTKE